MLWAFIFGSDGFLGTRGSFLMDFVVTALVGVLPILAWSVWLVRVKQQYQWHKWVQTTLALVLLATVVLFEVDVRVYGWRDRAAESTHWIAGGMNDAVDYSLIVHLLFAIPTPFLWGVTLFLAWRRFPHPPAPSPHSRTHVLLARIASAGMLGTAATGWVFYYLAFIA